ncbi:N-methyl-L-tryptophan oxidase [Rhodococcus sp. HM1]|uniref:N-methyl-L-tryptophan oxidase n=1 Tax=unclassified Rhodococcus (in: high G+C Gram-positive bacteria) TaxID=192944 RepID=UPI0018CDC5C2|nr:MULTISPECIES: N-methyl-L-tryptophan oxidase [unclassified Rhodococcus (in: high G+C Gram-positive bacteria)]MBH0118330.1 N-methyl-L-tryptophan oxidase [Rhodococcus sp. CX]MCK8669673.1 N-methyl-L-tryptophan oxidase [Rhodococcus sp. HM1]
MSRIQGRADVVIVGGGVIGSAAAWRLAERGRSVVLLEQFGPGHRHGASHGSSRIYRQAYDGEFYTGLAARALPLWRALEDTTGTSVLTLTGAVDHGLPAALAAKAKALAALGIPHELLDPAEAGRRWPGIRFDTRVLHHPDAGRLHADRSVQALNHAAAHVGADIRHDDVVRGIRSTATGVEVVTDGTTIAAAHVVVAAGAWTRSLLADAQLDVVPELPQLRTTQEQPAHFVPIVADWPSFVHHRGAGLTGEGIYGLGSEDGIKIGEHGTGPVVEPETRDYRPDPAGVERLVDYATAWLPGVDPSSVVADTCLYTTTPDSNFVVDRVGDVTVAAGFSGHGFKFAPVIGELVADLVDGRSRALEPLRFGARQAVAAR